MDEEEVAKRLAILTEMLLGHPGEVQEDGLRWMLKVTAPIPLELLPRACLLASTRQLETAFAPGPGQIIKAAIDCSPSGEYSPSIGTLKPKWFRQGMRRLRAAERPMETGHRLGKVTSAGEGARSLIPESEEADARPSNQSGPDPKDLRR
ncbi:MAG: hypothetical protein ACTSP0_09255 [Alphaproteobacteria bacterium]